MITHLRRLGVNMTENGDAAEVDQGLAYNGEATSQMARIRQIRKDRRSRGWPAVPNWTDEVADIDERHVAIAQTMASIDELGKKLPKFELATIDVFVEKAQNILDSRSNALRFTGSVAAWGSVALLLIGFLLIYHHGLDAIYADKIAVLKGVKSVPAGALALSTVDAIIIVARGLSLGGLIGGASVFLGKLAFASFHEAEVLSNKRHSLRQGRLFFYLKMAGPDAIETWRQALDIASFEKAFGWNITTNTAFGRAEIKEISSKSPVSVVFESLLPPAMLKEKSGD